MFERILYILVLHQGVTPSDFVSFRVTNPICPEFTLYHLCRACSNEALK